MGQKEAGSEVSDLWLDGIIGVALFKWSSGLLSLTLRNAGASGWQ